MAEFERIPLSRRPNRNWLRNVLLAVAAFLAVAIVKPWDLGRPLTAGVETALPTFYVAPTQRTGPRDYDPRLFGLRVPDPAWELWPAGYVVQFGLAGPVKVHRDGQPTPRPGSSGDPEPTRSGAEASPPTSGPPGSQVPEMPIDEGFVDLGPADHLVALGINTPLDVRVASVRLSILTDEAITAVPIVRLPTLWEASHFLVIAPEDPGEAGQPTGWAPALYRLDLITAFGEVLEIDLRVRPPLDGPGSDRSAAPERPR